MNQSMNENEAQCCEGVDVQYDNKTKATLASPRKQKQRVHDEKRRIKSIHLRSVVLIFLIQESIHRFKK